MEKLTLEHLAPYLPYGLKGIFTELPGERPFKVTGLTIDDEEDEELVNVHGCPGRWGGQVSEISNFKPILRPLSDLFNPLINPVPINTLKRFYGWDYLWQNVYNDGEPFNIHALRYACVKKMIAEHFDVFGLIEKGLAIDINTLPK